MGSLHPCMVRLLQRGRYLVSNTFAIQLVSLDLDGTALDGDADHDWLADEVVEILNQAGRRGVVWCSNSGRHFQNQLGLIQACRHLTNLPVAVLAGERYIHWCKPVPRGHEPFNSQMDERMRELHPKIVAAVEPFCAGWRQEFQFSTEIERDSVVGWKLAADSQVEAFYEQVSGAVASIDDAQVLRNGVWIIVTHVLAGKGVLLAELARCLDIPRENILAVGDQWNDLDMLDGRSAAHVACPADADPKVIDTVRAAGGYISGAAGFCGTAEILRRFLCV